MKIILIGACGKMGRMTAELGKEEIVCGVDETPFEMPFPVYRSLWDVPGSAEIAIDFSSARGVGERLHYCEQTNTGLVFAATGLSGADWLALEKSAKKIPLFQAENLSVGIGVMQMLVRRAAEALRGFDAEIIERHHSEKRDAPSGTALLLAENIRAGFGKDSPLCCGRKEERRKAGEIGIHAVRGGEIVGMHEVMFAGKDEILSISHTALSRAAFARGALRAAHWLLGKDPGLYRMQDLLGDILSVSPS